MGSSDHGIVYVFDQMTGNKMVKLRVAEQGMVQTEAVDTYNMTYCWAPDKLQTHSHEQVHTIVAMTLNMRVPRVIKIWVYKATPPATARSDMCIFNWFANTVLLLVAFIIWYKYAGAENMVRK